MAKIKKPFKKLEQMIYKKQKDEDDFTHNVRAKRLKSKKKSKN